MDHRSEATTKRSEATTNSEAHGAKRRGKVQRQLHITPSAKRFPAKRFPAKRLIAAPPIMLRGGATKAAQKLKDKLCNI
jgi:hypothetical protein